MHDPGARPPVVAPALLVPLASATDPRVAGGKAASLATLLRKRVAVPEGWVVTLHADRLRRAGELSEDELDAQLRERVCAAGPDAPRRYAVRSSAETEDGTRASFAGQFRTELDVTAAQVPAAVRRVAASLHGTSTVAYARRLGVPVPCAMGVLVQVQVHPVLAGVCFTAHPVSGESVVVLEYTDGLADGLVSGGAVAGSHLLPRRATGGTDERSLSGLDAYRARWLSAAARLALTVEAVRGVPQDIEWAVDRRGLWLLQARPITTLGRSTTRVDAG